MRYALYISVVALTTVFSSCGKKDGEGNEEKLFELLSPEQTGIDFVNTVPENDTLNQFTYHYLFNGNGVSAGDINNDGLTDLLVTGNAVPAKLFLNKGDFKFEDITAKAGIKTTGWMSGVNMADVNNDGYLDIYICRSGPENSDKNKHNYLFINNKNATFTESAAAWKVDDAGNATCASFFDMDNDGDLDMYLGNHAEKFYSDINVPFTRGLHLDAHNQQHMFRNDGNTFTDISEESGTKAMGYCLSATPGDFNRDGLTDLYVCNDYHVPDYYYINNGNGTFTESFTSYFKHSSANSMGSDAADYNNDGWLDIISVDMLPEDPRRFMLLAGAKDLDFFNTALSNGYGYQYMHNALQTNQGKGHFSDLAFLNGVARSDWSWSPVFTDFDNDGLTDLFVSNGYYRDVTNMDFMLYQDLKMKQTGKPVQQKEILEKLPFEKLKNYVYKNQGNYSFKNVAEDWGLSEATLSTGATTCDLNNDGFQEIIVCNQGDPIMVYKNLGNKSNYLNIRFEGDSKNNKFGIGNKVFVQNDTGMRLLELYTNHGFQSSSSPILHFGLGENETVKKLTVVWTDGRFQEFTNVKSNQTLIVKASQAAGKYDFSSKEVYTFEEITNESGLSFLHEDEKNPDFKREPLIPHRFTQLGPGAATGDVNGDGLADVFITNARGSRGSNMFIQTSDGKFQASSSQPWKQANTADLLGCLLFDADSDGDNDLYVVAGGSEYTWPSSEYKHKLYLNDGKGNFTEKANALSMVNTSGSCATAGDYDADGDLDLFVAGRITPGFYPQMEMRSYLLRNDNGVFTDVTEFVAPDLKNPGMICAAVFSDYNNDNKLDLVVTGEWMPIAFLQNTGEKFINQTGSVGSAGYSGWFNSLLPIDIDNDGDMDYVAGNKGDNSFLQAGQNNPLKIYWADVDGNGAKDVFMSYTKEGRNFPVYQLDEMAKGYPGFISKKFTTYNDIAGKSIEEIFGEKNVSENLLTSNMFSSLLLVNNGGNFEIKVLPRMAQASPIYGMIAADIDGNGFEDIMCIGNSNSPRVTHGRDDAFNGFILWNNKGKLTWENGFSNGFIVPGDAKSLVYVPGKNNGFTVVATQNSDAAKVFKSTKNMRFVAAEKQDIKAVVKLKDGSKRIHNLTYGSGYLSCQMPGVWVQNNCVSIEFVNSRGNKRNVVL